MNAFLQDKTSLYLDQSIRDSPCRLRVRDNDTLFSLAKWGGAASLDFGRGAEWAGRLATSRNELVIQPYAEPEQEHLIRRLDSDRFEYDVILLSEPETNRIRIDLSFPDGLEFYRQPSREMVEKIHFRCPNNVIDSYAVYWKERNGVYKTGKFCHIYRPLIKDARGRSVWGELDITGTTMTVTIPEWWLADAQYPVVVDPVIGTQTRGALNVIDWYNEGDPTTFMLDCQMALNRFTAPQAIQGQCTSYIYSYVIDDTNGQAVCFTNNGSAPYSRLSRNEQIVSLDRSVATWVPSTFSLSRTIAAGETFWYGYNAKYGIKTYYDLGGTFRKMFTDEYSVVPDVFSDYGDVWSIIMSMYFDYTTAQNYTRVIGAGMGAGGTATRKLSALRVCSGSTGVLAPLLRIVMISRKCLGAIGIEGVVEMFQNLIRTCVTVATGLSNLTGIQTLIRFCASIAGSGESVKGSRGVIRSLTAMLGIFERVTGRMILKKEDLIIVSRITKELSFKGKLV
jgi:hypothetical protein